MIEYSVVSLISGLTAAMGWLIGFWVGQKHRVRIDIPHTPALLGDGDGNVRCYGRVLVHGYDAEDGSIDASAGDQGGD